MGTMILKCTAILTLVLATALNPTQNLQLLLGIVVFTAGIAVAAQAMRAKKYVWATVFAGMALFFNPILVIQSAYSRHIAFNIACVAAFALSLFLLENLPRKTVTSIIHQNSDSESL